MLRGGAGEDSILGGGGNDALDGGSGADYLKGFTGNDTMTGGEGADRFVFDGDGFVGEILDGGVGLGNRDVIADFCRADGDVIDLSGYRSSLLPSTTPPPIFVGQEGFRMDPVVDGYRLQVRYEVEGARTILQVYAPLQEVPAPFPPGTPNVDIELLGVQGVSTDDLFLG